jgi:hypothetical protein
MQCEVMTKQTTISERQFRQMIREELINRQEIEEVAPPGEEELVKKLKKDPDVDNPWALAWSIHNKKKKKNESRRRDCDCGCNDCHKKSVYESKRPFTENRISQNVLLREFNNHLSSDEYVWHRDPTDRAVTVLEGSGWQLQFDNELPKKIEEGRTYRIPKGVWHRIIKGTTPLNVMITEAKTSQK